jgi:hypothetical protein
MTMMTWLADAIRQEGAKVQETNGWKTRGWGSDSDFVGGRGVMEHHTASSKTAGNAPALGFVTSGSSIAPLCNLLIGRDGTVFVIAAGKANHGGLGGPWKTVPRDAANTYTVGIEIENNGVGEPYSDAQMLAVHQSTTAILERQKKDHTWAVAHKEWAPTRKIDPSFSMGTFRADLKAFMEGEEDDMAEERDGYTWQEEHPNQMPPEDKSAGFKFGAKLARKDKKGIESPEPGGPGPLPDHMHVPGGVKEA